MRFPTLSLASSLVALLSLSTLTFATPLDKRAPAPNYTQCKGSGKKIAITFDDGPHEYETKLLATLKKYNAKATFFINGNNWRCAYDEARVKGLRDLVAAGMEIGSHTWSHPYLSNLTWDQTHAELYKVELLMSKTLGLTPHLFRAPYGDYKKSLSAIGARKQVHVSWNFDSEDSLGTKVEDIKKKYKSIVDKKLNNIIALNHSVQNHTVNEVMPYALDILKKAGYKFVTVSECLGIPAYQSKKAPSKRDSSWKCERRPTPVTPLPTPTPPPVHNLIKPDTSSTTSSSAGLLV